MNFKISVLSWKSGYTKIKEVKNMGNTQKHEEKSVPYYQRYSTDELLLQLSDWYALIEMFGPTDYYEKQITFIEKVLSARVRQKNV